MFGRRQVALRLLLLLTLVFGAVACAPAPKDVVVAIPGATDPPVLVETIPSAGATVEPRKKPSAIAWETSETKARARARSRGLALVVFLFAEWSVPAVQMDRLTWSDASVLERASSFVALRLDVSSGEGQAQADADRFAVTAVPAVLIFDPDGTEVGRFEGFASAGDLVDVLKTIAPSAD